LVGSLSMVGIPIFSGFVSKLMFAEAAVQASPMKMFPTLVVLAISTILNAIYFLKTVLRIYTPEKKEVEQAKGFVRISWKEQTVFTIAIVLFILLNIVLGTNSKPIIELLIEGLHNFM